jgi:hypothetical protein
MDADSYLNKISKELKKYQELSVEEHKRGHNGKNDFFLNVEKMQEQINDIDYILKDLQSEKNELDYGLRGKVDETKINTLKYIVEHLLERVNVLELLRGTVDAY